MLLPPQQLTFEPIHPPPHHGILPHRLRRALRVGDYLAVRRRAPLPVRVRDGDLSAALLRADVSRDVAARAIASRVAAGRASRVAVVPARDARHRRRLAFAAADALVTGDADILGARDRAGVPVLTPAEFRDWLAARP